MQKFLFGAAAALFLLAAPAPAPACDDCKNCDHKKPVTAQATEKKEDKGCHCTKDGGKCKCGEKCTCEHCKEHRGEKKDDTKKS